MRNIFSKIDFTLAFRLCLSFIMLVAAYRQSDMVAGAFGAFLIIYALIGAKYKVGCGYNHCRYTPKQQDNFSSQKEDASIQLIDIK